MTTGGRLQGIIAPCFAIAVRSSPGPAPLAKKAHLKKTYPLHVEGKHPDRLLEATKHEIRKYIKREQNKPRPAGVDFWDFDCKFGSSAATAESIHPGALTERINAYAAEKAESFYVELIAKPGLRKPRAASPASGDEHHED